MAKATATVTVAWMSEAALAAAFTEWDRRWREEPERFATEAEHLAGDAETYGEACAPYLLAILAGQGVTVPKGLRSAKGPA